MAPARLSRIITTPAAINTTAMTNQIMVRPLSPWRRCRAVCKSRPDGIAGELSLKPDLACGAMIHGESARRTHRAGLANRPKSASIADVAATAG